MEKVAQHVKLFTLVRCGQKERAVIEKHSEMVCVVPVFFTEETARKYLREKLSGDPQVRYEVRQFSPPLFVAARRGLEKSLPGIELLLQVY